jgi:hypothetical protein
MRKYFLIILFIFVIPVLLKAKKLDSLKYVHHKEFILQWDNDIFVYKDYYYTQGAFINYINPAFRKNPVNHILIRLKNADIYYGLGIAQQIFTPKDVHDTLLNLVDRPYSGTLFLSSFNSSSIPRKKLRFTSTFDLGFLGPLSGAKQAQKYIHEWLGLDWPKGWDFQIKNRPYINYSILVEKGLISIPYIFDFTGSSRLRIGNIYDDAQIGATIRLGRINNLFNGFNLGNKKYTENRNFEWFIYGGSKITGVLYNATLMGGITPPKAERNFKFNQIENVITEVFGGMQVAYKYAGIRAQVTWKSPEFETGEQHGWGSILLYLRF